MPGPLAGQFAPLLVAVAGGRPAVRHCREGRLRGAGANRERAAGGEHARGAAVRRRRVGGGAAQMMDRERPVALTLHAWRGGHQQRGIGMPWRAEHLADRAVLDDPAAVQDDDAVGDARQRAEIVRDDHDRQAQAVAQSGEQPQDVVPVARVERADRLVAQQQPRPGGQRPGDSDSLPLSAGDLPGRPVAQRGVEPHLREGAVDLLADLPRVEAAADSEPLADDLRDGQVGVERAQRVLEDQLDVPAAALSPARAAAQPGDLGSREDDPALPRPYQADDGPGQGGLARAGLADQADDLAGPDIEVHAGQHLAGAPAVAEDYIDTRDGEQRGRGRRRGLRHLGGHRAANSAASAAPVVTAVVAAVVTVAAVSSGSVARTQRAWCTWDSGTRLTGPDRHASMAAGQRPANRQPVMSAPARGGCPGMTRSSRRRKSPTDATWSRAWVYGCLGRSMISSTGPDSTTSPA